MKPDPLMQSLILDIGTLLQEKWISLVVAEAKDTGWYSAHILREDALVNSNGATIRVAAVDVPYARWLEEGHEAFNLAEKIGPSKWRLTSKGNQILRIPFRHYVPITPGGGSSSTRRRNEMPANVYNAARTLEFKQLWGRSGPGGTTQALRGRQTGGQLLTGIADRAKKSKYVVVPGLARKYEGMFRTNPPSPRGGPHTNYMTIRTLTPKSRWIIPAMAAHHFTKRTVDSTRAAINQMVAERMRAAGREMAEVIIGDWHSDA